MKQHRPLPRRNPIRTLILAAGLLLQVGAVAVRSQAAAGDVDLSFDPGSGINGRVTAIAEQPDGKVIIGGEFTMVKGLARSRLARLNADGSGDATFYADAGLDFITPEYPAIHSIVVQTDGRVLVGGTFLTTGSANENAGIARLEADGSLDSTFSASLSAIQDGEGGSYWSVNAIVVQPDGRILIGGYFLSGSGANVNTGIARLQTDGSVDPGFDASFGIVYALVALPDGKVLIGGGSPGPVARLNADGTVDTTFSAASVFASAVSALAVQTDGKVLVGGAFSTGNGDNRNLIRLNENGSLDAAFNPVLGSTYVSELVEAVAVQADGKVVLAGGFETVNGASRSGIARLNLNGTLDEGFNPGTGIGGTTYNIVYSMTLHANGRVLIGGAFTRFDGVNRNWLARLDADGSLDDSFDPGATLPNTVARLALQPDGKVLIGGGSPSALGTLSRPVTRLNANGSADGGFVSTLLGSGSASCIALQGDGKIIVGGQLNVPSHPAVARLGASGDLEGSYQPAIGASSSDVVIPTVITPQSENKALVGGYMLHYECDPFDGGCVVFEVPFLQRFDSNGAPDTTFNSSIAFNGPPGPRAVTVQPDGKLLVAGQFLAVQGTPRKGIARLNADGSLDASFDPGEGAFGIASIVLQPDAKMLIGGFFATVNGAVRQGIARLHPNGSVDTSFSPVTSTFVDASSVALQPDGKILIAGNFTTLNGTNRKNIARLNTDGSLDLSFDPDAGPNGVVRSIALQPDGNVLIGGDFTQVDGVPRPYVARLYGGSGEPVPALTLAQSDGVAILSWPVTSTDFQLQENTDLTLANGWSPVEQATAINGGQVSVTVPTSAARKFFRLKTP